MIANHHTYSRKDIGVLCYVAGLLTGVILAFSSCAMSEEPNRHITSGAHQ